MSSRPIYTSNLKSNCSKPNENGNAPVAHRATIKLRRLGANTYQLVGTPFAERRVFFERHERHRNGNVVCPSCGYLTFRYRNRYDYCSLCHWEDDGQDGPWADQPNGGPNGHSLSQAMKNFEETFSVWSSAEAGDFSDDNQYRLFSEAAYREKMETLRAI